MVLWQEELTRGQVEARQQIEEFRRQFAQVQEWLEAKEGWLSALELTHKTVNTVVGEASQVAELEPGSVKPPADAPWAGPEAEAIRRV